MRYIDSGARNPTQTLGFWMKALDPSTVAELRFQTGFFGFEGVMLLAPTLARLRAEDAITRCLVGSNDLRTAGEDVRRLAELLGLPRSRASLAVCAFGNAFFHPKILHLRRHDGSQASYVGSANLTESGVGGRHVEAGVLLDTREGDSAAELDKVAAAIDAWFAGDRLGCFPIVSTAGVESLVERGILAAVAESSDIPPPTRKLLNGGTFQLPTLSPLFPLHPLGADSPSTAPPATSTQRRLTREEAASTYFMMELSKNRHGGRTYQADIGKRAFTEFFRGKIGGQIDIRINTVSVTAGAVTRTPRDRKLVDVRSRNYRVEIEFPRPYPSSGGRPVVTFRRRTSGEFDCLLLMPGDLGYAEAMTTLTKNTEPGLRGRMRKAAIDSAKLASDWPTCPLLL